MWELEGMDQLLNRINEMGRRIDGAIEKEALVEGAKVVQESAKEKVRKRTHNLENHIICSEVQDGQILIGPDQQGHAFYGYFLEFGRSAGSKRRGPRRGPKTTYNYPKMDPMPFMQPAFEENKDNVEREMAKVIRHRLNL